MSKYARSALSAFKALLLSLLLIAAEMEVDGAGGESDRVWLLRLPGAPLRVVEGQRAGGGVSE